MCFNMKDSLHVCFNADGIVSRQDATAAKRALVDKVKTLWLERDVDLPLRAGAGVVVPIAQQNRTVE